MCWENNMNLYQKMLNIEENADDVYDLLKGYYDLIPCPMALINENYDVVSYFVLNETLADEFFNTATKSGHWNVELISDVTKHFLDSHDDKIIFEFQGRRRLFYKIRKEDIVLGYLAILETDTPLEQLNQEILLHFVRSLAKRLSRMENSRSLSSVIFFLSSLLNNGISDKKIMEEKMRDEEIDVSSVDQYLLISLSNLKKGRYHSFEREVNHLFDDAVLIYKDRYLLVFQHDIKVDDRIMEFLRKNHVTAILSNPLTSMFLLSDSYRINTKLLHFLEKIQKDRLYFRESDYFCFLPIIMVEKEDVLLSMIHPNIKRLWKYDRENDNEYCFTLFTYLSSGKSLTDAAKSLCFHKNTIGYRINQIKEIIEDDLLDYKTNLNYLTSLSIVEYLKNRN